MKKSFIRSTIFNILFFGVAALFSILYIPGLLLPRPMFVGLVRFWLRVVWVLERVILKLNYRVEGLEHIPKHGGYIIAAKHQSAYETLKVHLIFKEPAVILKRELLSIPLFGWYLTKSGALAIDRGSPEAALRSIQNGVAKIKEEGRAIVIFPQGTRTRIEATTDEKPYKPGIARIQQLTELPILPVALNSGVFWGRNAWMKSAGTVTFKILPPIMPGKERQELMQELEEKIEHASAILASEAMMPPPALSLGLEIAKASLMVFFLGLACAGYAFWWKQVERVVRQEYAYLQRGSILTPEITGFPFKMHIRFPEETIKTNEGDMVVKDIHVSGYPLPLAPITIKASELKISSIKWHEPLLMRDVEIYGRYWNKVVTIDDSLITHNEFRASAKGAIDFKNYPPPQADLMVSFMNHPAFLQELANRKILEKQSAMLMTAGFTTLMDEHGIVSVPVTQRNDTLYAGPFAFAKLPVAQKPLE